jgi:Lrp/AsnC family leucine-responsive transcriptional regulator
VTRDVFGLDRIDREILRLLQVDGRMTIASLARRVNLSPTPCHARVRRLERDGFIRGYAARVPAELLGIAGVVFVEVRVERTTPAGCARFIDAVSQLNEVSECYKVTGEFDFLLKMHVRDLEAYRECLSARLSGLPGIVRTHSFLVVDEMKRADISTF